MHALGLTFRLAKVHKTDQPVQFQVAHDIGRCADGFGGPVSRDVFFLSLPVLSEHIFNSVNFTNSIKEKWSAPYYDMHALWTPPVHIPPRAPELLPCS
ncbi:hypothetical protein N7530_003167 [Penicillium desertorum]|jgi:hypothetical protein|uniref:Uncharacterized protein n=1 Tax=Penicillium desertorum TaxID=1303715 RepID=A0A9W9WVU3_9EURO|nr:hypothetical protein N7530_003167 [Penicillium desertorum]